jgi:UDP-N-acetylglucosamine diphosphorylase / glucose-1-phosphate thymidylyltransferase / UDP-N-acetylgalactosamine diphosphorylase / glucosamine-1-phosphate N-acetyltransferase / galactosamine-1-phosphate N-acetyltransferase
MPGPALILFDDDAAARWQPFALTRPAGELLFGTLTLRARAEEALGLSCALHLAEPHLIGFGEEGAPPVAAHGDAPREGDRLFLLSRFVPAWEGGREWVAGLREAGPVRSGGRVVGWYSPAGDDPPGAGFLRDPGRQGSGGGGADVPGRLLEHVWELISGNPEQIGVDVRARFPDAQTPALPPGVHHWGDHPLVLDPTAELEPGCALDTSGGPIWLDRGARVRAFSRLAGPAYIGPDSAVLGGSVEAVSVGPVCKVRGELAESVCLGYTNKQHDGHMGHAYLGRWVNLGAETTNSDLKNNYGTIRIWTPEGPQDTGEIKLGCLLGDHVKTGIGLLLNTGTVVGAGSNLYGAAMPPTFVPPFSWGTGEELTEYRVDKFLEVAERAMGRRQVELSEAQREQLRRAWERGRADAGTR